MLNIGWAARYQVLRPRAPASAISGEHQTCNARLLPRFCAPIAIRYQSLPGKFGITTLYRLSITHAVPSPKFWLGKLPAVVCHPGLFVPPSALGCFPGFLTRLSELRRDYCIANGRIAGVFHVRSMRIFVHIKTGLGIPAKVLDWIFDSAH